jgi:micrococcal nuclease
MYEYNVNVTRVVDGDTVDVDIDLGFGMVYKKQRVRLMGIDTPESRTRDKVEKLFGKASKYHLQHLLEEQDVTLISHDKGKFGRILGELFVKHEANLRDGHVKGKVSINQQMIADNHAVDYAGGNKEEIQEQHLIHRKLLIEKGTVTQEQIDEVS